MTPKLLSLCSSTLFLASLCVASGAETQWRHLSSKQRDLPAPNVGKQQTSATVFDVDGDKTNDFVVTERTTAPAVVGFHRIATGWERFVIEPGQLRPEAGATSHDVDGDGDLDFVAGGDGQSNHIWWWENPGGALATKQPWKRHLIKDSGANKRHDLIFGDLDILGKPYNWESPRLDIWLNEGSK